MGTKGQIRGNMEKAEIVVDDFVTGDSEYIKVHTPRGGHCGSDMEIMREFIGLVAKDGDGVSMSDVSVDSHLMALAAEESRLKSEVIDFREFRGRNV